MQTLFRKTGYLISSLCLLHCLATPFIILLVPAISGFFRETIEFWLVMAIIPFSLFAFIPTWLKHKNAKLAKLYGLGMFFIILSRVLPHNAHEITSNTVMHASTLVNALPSTIILICGVLLVSFATYKNNRHTHVCSNPAHHHH